MNKVYKLVWNQTLGAWVVVSEQAKGKKKKSSKVTGIVSVISLMGVVNAAYAVIPEGSMTGANTIALGVGSQATKNAALAYGQNANADGLSAIAIGPNAKATQTSTIAIGGSSKALATGAVALGESTNASGTASIALGNGSVATNTQSIAIGDGSNTSGQAAIAVGGGAKALGDYSLALGSTSNASGLNSLALGSTAKASAEGAAAFGSAANASGLNSLALGSTAKASAEGAAAFGLGANASGQNALALGVSSNASGANSTAIGSGATSVGNSTSIGYGSKATASNASALGIGSTANGQSSLAVGHNANAVSASSTALGASALAQSTGAVAVGYLSNAYGDRAIAMGSAASATGDNSVAIGRVGVASGTGAVALGNGAKATATNTIAQGISATASAANATSIGALSTATGENSSAFGAGASAAGASSVSQGYNASASGDNAVALGATAAASGANAVALGSSNAYGTNSIAQGVGTGAASNAVALGSTATASGQNGIAVGLGAKATATNTMALGLSATASVQDAIAVGRDAKAVDAYSLAVGYGTVAGATSVVALGQSANASGKAAVAIGRQAAASVDNTVALGNMAKASGVGGVALGLSSNTSGLNAVALGVSATASGANTISAGAFSAAAGENSSAFGMGANAAGASSVSLGYNTAALGDNTIALGREAVALGLSSIAQGHGANAAGSSAIALGVSSQSLASGTIALGANSVANVKNAIAIGATANAAGDSAIAQGFGAVASVKNAIAVGVTANASADSAIAQGFGALANANFAVAVGLYSRATGISSVAQGYNAAASGLNSVALGSNAIASVDNSVALGSGSTTTAPTGNAVITNSTAPSSVVSVGTGSNLRRIQNVADGSALQDAVTVAQLIGTQTNIKNIIGSSATIANGNLIATNIGGTGKNTIDEALKASKTEVAQGKNVTVTNATGANGQTIYTVNANSSSVTGSSAVIVTPGAKDANGNTNYAVDLSTVTQDQIKAGTDAANTVSSKGLTFTGTSGTTGAKKLGDSVSILGADSNITTTADATGVKVTLAKDLVLSEGSIKFGDTGPSISHTGINAGNTIISNVAKGVAPTDAANVSQVNAAKTEVVSGTNTTVTSTTGANGQTIYTVNAVEGGQAVQNTVSAGSGKVAVTQSTKDGAIDYAVDLTDDVKEKLDSIESGLTFAANSGTAHTSKLGETISILGATGNTDFTKSDAGTNIYTQVDGDGNITVGLAKDLVDLTSITVKNGVDGKDGTTVIGKDGISVTGAQGPQGEPGKTTTIDGDKITTGNITTETIHLAGKDGKDGVDLTADFMDGVVAYDRNLDGTINTGVITLDGKDGKGTTITNVADGVNGKDAVNKDQLDAVNTALTDKGLTFAANSGTAHTSKLGETISILGATSNTDFTKSDAGKNIYTQVDGDGNITVGLAKDLVLTNGSIKFGDTGPSISHTGINAGNTIISNVAKGVAPTDVATVGQLTKVTSGKNTTVNGKLDEVTGQTIYTVDADSSSVVSGKTNSIKVDVGTKDGENNTEYTIDLSDEILTKINSGSTAANTVATKGLTFTADNTTTTGEKKLGETVAITGDKNITTTADTNGIQITLAKDLDFTGGSIKFADTLLNANGLTIKNGPSITKDGINAGNQKITGVVAGDADTDAVNYGQLKALEDIVKNYSGGTGTGSVGFVGNSGDTYTTGTSSTVTIQGDANNKNFANSDAGKNIYTQSDKDGNITIGLAKDVDLSKDGSLTVGTTKVTDGQIIGLTNKDLSASDFGTVGRAATEEQLGVVKSQVDTNTTNIANLTTQLGSAGVGLVQQADPTAEVTVAKNTGGKVVNVAGTDGDRRITGVANGTSLNDAVNLGQLNAVDSKIDNLTMNLEQAFYDTNQRIDSVEKRANAGIAAAMALESAPYVPGKFTYAAGAAYHGGENAIGVTLRRTADSGRWSITGGVAAASEGEPSFRIGISGVID